MLAPARASWRYHLAMLLVSLSTPLSGWAQAVQIANSGIWIASGDITSAVKACGVKADIEGGTFLLYGRSDRPGALLLTLHKATWHMPNLTVPITIAFAGGANFQFTGNGWGADIRADIAAENVRPFIHHFTADNDAVLVLPNGHEPDWHLDLHGTTPTVLSMGHCLEAAQIWLPPPFSQPPSLTSGAASGSQGAALPVQPPSSLHPPTAQGWVNPDTLPPSNP